MLNPAWNGPEGIAGHATDAQLPAQALPVGSHVIAGRPFIFDCVRALTDPLVVTASFTAIAHFERIALDAGLKAFLFICFFTLLAGAIPGRRSGARSTLSSILRAAIVIGALYLALRSTGFLKLVPGVWMVEWAILASFAIVLSHRLIRGIATRVARFVTRPHTAVIVGATAAGAALATQFRENAHFNTRFLGFFEDRPPARVGVRKAEILGSTRDLVRLVKERQVDVVYIALPMSPQPRIRTLLRQLHDTTASVYFVPDFFVADFAMAWPSDVNGIPVLAVCETPFDDFNELLKRASDIVMASLLLVIAAPAMLFCAAGVSIGSPGPVIFKQRRYGIDGREIVIYKFRTMTACEDGPTITQARKNDQRTTRFGAVLRKLSLDELPQLINVLQGRMSLVGPRPHAVAHNEQYRRLIDGYMLRHKIRPGITGLAQVSGCRGETDTLDKMERRVALDLTYLRSWSLQLDLWIIARTAVQVWRDPASY